MTDMKESLLGINNANHYQQVSKKYAFVRNKKYCFGFIFFIIVYVIFNENFFISLWLPSHNKQPMCSRIYSDPNIGTQDSGFLIKTKNCRIQYMDPFDPKILQFINSDKPPNCNTFKVGRLVKADSQSIYINWGLLENNSDIHNPQEVECKYCEFWRKEHPYREDNRYSKSVDTTYEFSTTCKKLENKTYIQDEEFIQVECFFQGKIIYSDYFAFPKIKTNKSDISNIDNKLNVLLVGVDAVSRLNLHRQMPKTINFLKNKVYSVEMLGYNKIGDNTFPNLVAVLSGLTTEELTSACWHKSQDIFDNCSMIWKNYSDSGFHTAYAEDSAAIGLFNYQKIGFRKQPTNFYAQAFSLASESKSGSDHRLNTYLCVGNRKTVELLLETAKQFLLRLKDVLTWSIFWSTSLSHDYLNLPRYGDQLYVDFLEELQAKGILNKTILIFLSDHGIRWGGIRRTYQGYVEERLPFLFLVFPDWFSEKYPLAIKNIQTNTKRLTTPFDLHETLLDLVDLTNVENSTIDYRTKEIKGTYKRGISLFLPVPEERTCKDAGITENWCTCHTSKTLSTKDSDVAHVAIVLVQHLNYILKEYSQCSSLDLHKIHSARLDELVIDKEDSYSNNDKIVDYQIVIETVPGNGLFEANIRHSPSNDSYTVVDSVSRLNTYGSQSRCITHYQLKLYCFCKSN